MLKRNIFLFKFYYFFWRFKPLAALMIIYFSQITHSYAAAMMIFSIFNIFYAFAKIPCGMLSDKIGRKPILIMANFFMTIAFFLLAVSGQYKIEQFLYIFAILWALGEAMAAGTVEALMYETSQSLGYSDKFYLIYSKSMVFDQLGCAFGAFWAMTITYFLPLQFVAWLSVFPSVMQLIVSYFFVEPDVKKIKFHSHSRTLFRHCNNLRKIKNCCFIRVLIYILAHWEMFLIVLKARILSYLQVIGL